MTDFRTIRKKYIYLPIHESYKKLHPIVWMLLTIGVQSTLKDVYFYVPFKLNPYYWHGTLLEAFGKKTIRNYFILVLFDYIHMVVVNVHK